MSFETVARQTLYRQVRARGGDLRSLADPRLLRPDLALRRTATTAGWACSSQQALAEALAGRTSILIAHRLSTVRAADMILVVEDGRIVERGTHDQLLARGGRYAELYDTQFSSHEEAVAA